MLTCRECKQEKPEEEFPYRDMARGVRHRLCKTCRTIYNQSWYAKNAATHKLAVAATRVVLRDRNWQWLQDLKADLKCIRCGETYAACLDFHHRDGTTKDMSLGEAISHGWSIARLEAELAKCDVLCANCHRRLHHEERLVEAQPARYLTCPLCGQSWRALTGPRCLGCRVPGISGKTRSARLPVRPVPPQRGGRGSTSLRATQDKAPSSTG